MSTTDPFVPGVCDRHRHGRAVGLCRRCGHDFCGDCLVRPFGTSEPALCVECALVVGGVRRRRARPIGRRRDLAVRRAQWEAAGTLDLTGGPEA